MANHLKMESGNLGNCSSDHEGSDHKGEKSVKPKINLVSGNDPSTGPSGDPSTEMKRVVTLTDLVLQGCKEYPEMMHRAFLKFAETRAAFAAYFYGYLSEGGKDEDGKLLGNIGKTREEILRVLEQIMEQAKSEFDSRFRIIKDERKKEKEQRLGNEHAQAIEIWDRAFEEKLSISVQEGKLDPELLYFHPYTWKKVTESKEYRCQQKGEKILKKSMPDILETIAPEGRDTITLIGLGPGTGKKEFRIIEESLSEGKKIDAKIVDASPQLLSEAVIFDIIKLLLEGTINRSHPLLPGLKEFAEKVVPKLPPEERWILDHVYLKFLNKHIDTKGKDFFKYITSAWLGLEQPDERIKELDKLDLGVNIEAINCSFEDLDLDIEPTKDRSVLTVALGNTPFGTHSHEETLHILNKVLHTPEHPKDKENRDIENPEEQDFNADYALISAFVSNTNKGDDKFEREKEEILRGYISEQFLRFVLYPLRKAMYFPQDADSYSKENSIPLEEAGEVRVEYEWNTKINCYRVAHYFDFNCDVKICVGGEILEKNKGESILLHYSNRPSPESCERFFKENGFKICGSYQDRKNNPSCIKYLIRELSQKEIDCEKDNANEDENGQAIEEEYTHGMIAT